MIIIRFNEIFLKSDPVKKHMKRKMVSNIKTKLPEAQENLRRGRVFLKHDFNEAKPVLEKTFGISSFSPATEAKNNPATIINECLKQSQNLSKNQSFAVRTARSWKGFSLTSIEMNEKAGEAVQNQTGAEVDLDDPDFVIGIEIHENSSFVYTKRFKGPCGLPLGTSERTALVYSGPNSLLAGWLMMRRGSPVTVIGSKEDARKLEQWSIGPELRYVESVEDAMEDCKALVKGVRSAEKVDKKIEDFPVFYPLLFLPEELLQGFPDFS